jgi:hypothetical protein
MVYWLVGAVLFYTVAGFFILPPIIRSVAVKQLSKALGREVAIQKVGLNPYALSASIKGLMIKDKDGQTFASWDEVFVNLQTVSFFGPAWTLDEVRVVNPYVRVQVNADRTFNFTDLVTQGATNSNSPRTAAKSEPSKPLNLRIARLQISGASASLKDLTTRTPFQRTVGPINITLDDFHTDPGSRNPYSVAGTTDAGEKFSWSGHFFLSPLRSEGEFSLENLSLNKYAPLYQDYVRVQILDGVVDVRSRYHVEFSPTRQIAAVTNTSFSLRSLKVAEAGGSPVAELGLLAVKEVSADAMERWTEVGAVTVSGARVNLRRNQDASVNVVELAKPPAAAPQASEAVLLLLRGITNAVSLFLNSTNAWRGTVHEVQVADCGVSLEDLVNSRPVRLELDQIGLTAKHISNVPGTNLTAALAIRWNTNGWIKTEVEASFMPLTVEARLDLERVELRALDPYLENKLNVFVLGSKLSLDSRVHLRQGSGALPEIHLQGNARLDDFSTLDGVWGEDLLKWSAVRVSGIEATLTPPSVSIREVAVDDAYARVVIETNKALNLMSALRLETTNAAASSGPKGKPAAAASAATSPAASLELPHLSIQTVVISNAAVQFTDRSIAPEVNVGVQQAGGTITGLSTEAMGHAAIQLQARVDKVGPVEVTGVINPMSQEQTNDIRVKARNVDLTPTSPYVGKFAGYQLAQGKLALDLEYHLKGRKLKAENNVVLDRFTFGGKVNSPDATKLPVRLGVAILKDRNGKIQLDVPIEGSLDDPQFRLRKVIIGAIENILVKVATSPFSLLGSVFGGRGEEIRYQDFAAGSFDLQPASKDKLDALAKGLYERPGLQLEIQGSADPLADTEGLKRVLFERQLRLAQWRALPAAQREELKSEQVTLTPEERGRLVQKLFAQAVASGALAPLVAAGEAGVPAQATNRTIADSRPAQISAATPRRFGPPERGSAQLMRREPKFGGAVALQAALKQPVQSTNSVAASPSAPAPAPTAADAVLEMERRLVGAVAVSASDLQGLAARRAEAVRDYVVGSGKVEASRLFFTEAGADAGRAQGARVYLQLQ